VLKEKLASTLMWSVLCVASAMLLDYAFTALIFHDYASYTPLQTFFIASTVALPATYALVSGRINLRQARDELALARDAAIRANMSKTMFFANMSHELRTPLNAVLGFSEMLQRDEFAAKRIEYARLIHSSGAHLLELVSDLLEVSRMDAGKLELKVERIRLVALIGECVEMIEPRAAASGLRLSMRIPPDVPDVMADSRALRQILLNLLSNAVKFSASGSRVEVSAQQMGSGAIALRVRDEGIGIADNDQALVFEPFKQAQAGKRRAHEGTGLGLPIVKGLAEAHGGRVSLQSELGRGTSISVFLPAGRVCARASQRPDVLAPQHRANARAQG
jgi:signal transduction histidine kinase